MKIILALSLMTFATLTQARPSRQSGDHNFICKSHSLVNGPKKVVRLKQMNTQQVREGKKIPFLLEYWNTPAYPRPNAVAPRVFSHYGIVEIEDVMFRFVSHDKKVSLTIFLDELNETTLYIDGRAVAQQMLCDEPRQF
jgi:hypothetical protein